MFKNLIEQIFSHNFILFAVLKLYLTYNLFFNALLKEQTKGKYKQPF